MARLKYPILIYLTLFANSCLEDIVNPVVINFDNASDLITYVETRTDILNGRDQPVLVDVDELHRNLNNYLVLDIRSQEKFETGHIPGAVHIKKNELLEYLGSVNTFKFNKIVIVSNTGQTASYAACLLKIAGYFNVFPLDGGMTYWNFQFSDELQNAQGDDSYYSTYTQMRSVKPPRTIQTPKVEFTGDPVNINEKIESRINVLLDRDDNLQFITANQFSSAYNVRDQKYDGYFLIYVLPDSSLHLSNPHGEAVRDIRVPQSTVFYDVPWSFQSSRDLFTLPLNKNILLFSPNGQRASFYQAYLHFIGHETARTIKYGCISIMDRNFLIVEYLFPTNSPYHDYKDTVYTPTHLTPYGFQEEKIRNYSVEAGSP